MFPILSYHQPLFFYSLPLFTFCWTCALTYLWSPGRERDRHWGQGRLGRTKAGCNPVTPPQRKPSALAVAKGRGNTSWFMTETFQVGMGLWGPHTDSDLARDATALLKKEKKALEAFLKERNKSNVSVNSVLWLFSYIQFWINRWRSCCWCNLTFSVHWSFCRKKHELQQLSLCRDRVIENLLVPWQIDPDASLMLFPL